MTKKDRNEMHHADSSEATDSKPIQSTPSAHRVTGLCLASALVSRGSSARSASAVAVWLLVSIVVGQ